MTGSAKWTIFAVFIVVFFTMLGWLFFFWQQRNEKKIPRFEKRQASTH